MSELLRWSNNKNNHIKQTLKLHLETAEFTIISIRLSSKYGCAFSYTLRVYVHNTSFWKIVFGSSILFTFFTMTEVERWHSTLVVNCL